MSDKPRVRLNADGSYRLDAWTNAASGMGMPGIDKSNYSGFQFSSPINWAVLAKMYRYDWLSRKICDRPASDATRRWIEAEDTGLLTEMERVRFKQSCRKAIAWSRLFGGAAIMLIVEDGMTAADPLDPSKVRRIIDTPVLDRHHLQPQGSVEDELSAGFGEPEFYVTDNGTLFHRSRVIKFSGVDLTQDELEANQWWGGSYLELYREVVESFQGSMQDVRHIMTESGIGTLQIPGLTSSVAAGGKIFDVIQKRLDQFNLSKSVYRTAAMDAEETFDFKNRQLAGLSDLLDRFMTQVAGATDMTELVLFGTTPSGLNASQEEQKEVYNDMVRGVQEADLMHAINKFNACHNRGDISEWEFRPLSEPTDMQRADIRLKEAQAIAALLPYVSLAPEEIAEHVNRTGYFELPTEGLLPGDGVDDEPV